MQEKAIQQKNLAEVTKSLNDRNSAKEAAKTKINKINKS